MASYVSTFTGDGSEVHFTAGFPILRLTDLAVVVDNVWLTLGTDYSVAGPTSASVATLAVAPGVGAVVTLRSAVGYTPTDPAAVTTSAPTLSQTDTDLWEAIGGLGNDYTAAVAAAEGAATAAGAAQTAAEDAATAAAASVSAVYDNVEPTRLGVIRSNTADAARTNYWHARYKPCLYASGPDRYAYLDNLVAWTLTSAAQNANGTITIQAGGTMVLANISGSIWSGIGVGQAAYLWVSETAPVYGSTPLTFAGQWNGSVNMGVALGLTEVAFGVHRMKLTNDNGGGGAWTYLNCTITNTSGAAVTIYPLMVTAASYTTVPRFRRFDGTEGAGADQAVRRFDFWKSWGQERAARHLAEKLVTKCADSVGGNNSSDGTSIRAAKKDISSLPALATNDTIGLWRGGEWPPTLASTSALYDIAVVDVQAGRHGVELPILTAMAAVPNGSWSSNGDGTYSYTWTGSGSASLVDNAYDEVYAVEVTTAAEAATPIAAERRMRRVAAKATVITTAGSDFVESLGANQWRVTIRPSDSLAPGAGAYRYEVTAYYYGLYMRDDPAGRQVSGLRLVGASFGYGELALPHDSEVDRCILMHGPIHQAVIYSGLVQRSLFYSADTDEGALTFYSSDPDGRSFEARECFFFNASGVISHNASGTTYSRGAVRNCAFVFDRKPWNNALWASRFVSLGAADATVIEGNYFENAAMFCAAGNTVIRNNAARGVAQIVPQSLIEHNVIGMEPWSDPDNINNRGMAFSATNQAAGAVFRNNLLHWKDTQGYGDGTAELYVASSTSAFTKNIHMFDATRLTMGTFPLAGPSWTADYNVYIVVGLGTGEAGYVYNGATLFGYESYVTNSGEDVHSLFVDLRNDPRGGKAVFVDPDNGDFRWAATDIAKQVAEYCKANGVGPSWTLDGWPEMPTVDEAAQLIRDI